MIPCNADVLIWGIMIAALVVLANARAGDIIKTNASLGHVETDMDLRVEVLSLTVSKLGRDAIGHGVNPFNDHDFFSERAGTVVLAKITPPSPALKLMAKSCRLISFKDNLGTDLFTNASAGTGNNAFGLNRSFEVLSANEPGYFGVWIRSAQLPDRTATNITAEILLAFAPTSGEKSESRSRVVIKANEVATVGPVKIKFFRQHSHSHSQTNQSSGSLERVYWLAGFLPSPGTKIVSVAFLSEKSDDPILFVKDLDDGGNPLSSNNSSQATEVKRGEAKDDFSVLTGYSFTPPEDGKVTIKVRYFSSSALVEKHCLVSTGLSP